MDRGNEQRIAARQKRFWRMGQYGVRCSCMGAGWGKGEDGAFSEKSNKTNFFLLHNFSWSCPIPRTLFLA